MRDRERKKERKKERKTKVKKVGRKKNRQTNKHINRQAGTKTNRQRDEVPAFLLLQRCNDFPECLNSTLMFNALPS